MLNTEKFGSELKKYGFEFYSGVPCSFLKPLINFAINDSEYVMAANEGDAVAICAGAYLAGRRSVVLMQNSGLANAVSPLTSLNPIFKIPVLGFVSLRGEPGLQDEPQHELMGVITGQLLDVMKIPWQYLSADPEKSVIQLEEANKHIENNRSFFFIVKKDTFSEIILKGRKSQVSSRPSQIIDSSRADTFPKRIDVLRILNKIQSRETVFLTTTGKTGRELYDLGDKENNFYVVGSMGCVSSIGLGIALVNSEKKVVVIDGDGSLLMKMGAMATIGYYQPDNLLHILLDNNCHDSTGGQATVSDNVDFIKVAEACGYNLMYFAHDLNELDRAIKNWEEARKLSFIYLKITKGSKNDLGRPKIKPFEVKERFMRFLQEGQ